MPEPNSKESLPTPIPPVTVTMVGTGSGGAAPIPSGTVLSTPDHQPNLIIKVVTPVKAITIRFINSYLTMLVSLVGAGMTTNIIPASDFLHLVYKCMALSLASAGLGLLKDLVTIFGKLEQTNPLLTGSV